MTSARRLLRRLPVPVRRVGRVALRAVRSLRRAGRTATAPPVVGLSVTSVDAHQAREDVLRAVVGGLRAAGVAHTVVPPHGAWPARVVLAAEDAPRAWEALASALSGEGWACRPATVRRTQEPATLGAWEALTAAAVSGAATDGAVAVTRVLEAGSLRLADEIACRVEPWGVAVGDEPRRDGSTHEPGTLMSPWGAGTVAYLAPSAWAEATSAPQDTDDPDDPDDSGGVADALPHPPHLALPHLFDVSEPIDVVYTWVDGSDPRWRERRDAARARLDVALGPAADVESRYLSRDELRYSLRSVAAFAGWVRTIHVVTDGQVPAWLDVDHPRIRVVDHRDIFDDAEALPTFNSHAIESRLHHVPGLSERYLYLNDDVFFGRPVPPEMFFHGNGLATFFLSALPVDVGEASTRDLPVVSAAKQNRALVEREFGRTVTHKYFHAPHPQVRSVLLDLERRFPEEMAAVGRSIFRHPEDISVAASLHHHVAYATGRAVPGALAYRYVDLAAADAPARLAALLARRDRDVFCLNEVESSPEQMETQAQMLADFLPRYFPVPSPFERTP